MNKSTVVLLILSALALGSLIGVNLADGNDETKTLQKTEASVGSESSPIQSIGGAPIFRYLAPGDLPVTFDEFDRAEPSTIGENFIGRDLNWKTETLEITLPVDSGVEYKAIMQQGDSIVFDWKTGGGLLYTDFHGHDAAFGEKFFVRYEEQEGKQQSGSIVAAFTGEHGWYWLNMADKPVKITLRIAGFYSEIIKVDVEGYQ